jgi:nickel-type superoxide dismutase maturation protease
MDADRKICSFVKNLWFIFMPETANLIDILMLYFGLRKRVRIEGNSMLPTLNNGDEVLVKLTANVKINDIVLVKHPYKQSVKIIKRISQINENGVFLVGDNPSESSDSRTFGFVPIKNIEGKVVKISA